MEKKIGEIGFVDEMLKPIITIEAEPKAAPSTREILIPILKTIGFKPVKHKLDMVEAKEVVEFFDGIKWENYYK